MKTHLKIQKYLVPCVLGCLEEERRHTQEVLFSLKIDFLENPRACTSDNIRETICYAEVCKQIKKVAQEKSYHTVEHLGFEVFLALEDFFSHEKVQFFLEAHKVSPPVDGLQGGVVFQLESRT